MGRIRHSAIVVTGSGKPDADFAHAKAVELGLPVTPVISGLSNGYCSFLICPDGSKEGWDDSDKQEEARHHWIEWATSNPKVTGAYGMQGLYLDWVYLDFGGDDDDVEVRDHGDSDKHGPQHPFR